MSNSSSPPSDGRTVLPFHCLPTQPGERVLRGPGRPRRILPAPSADEREYRASLKLARAAALANDPLITAKSSKEVVARAILEMAREQAALAWERQGAQDRGLGSAEAISSRRVDALSKLANVIRDAHRAGLYGTDLSAKKLALVLDHWLQSIAEVAYETLPAEAATLFMTRYRAVLDGTDIAAI